MKLAIVVLVCVLATLLCIQESDQAPTKAPLKNKNSGLNKSPVNKKAAPASKVKHAAFSPNKKNSVVAGKAKHAAKEGKKVAIQKKSAKDAGIKKHAALGVKGLKGKKGAKVQKKEAAAGQDDC